MNKFFIVLFGGLVVMLVAAIFATPLVYFGWNQGIAEAIPSLTHKISLGSAFCMTLFISSVAVIARTSVTVRES